VKIALLTFDLDDTLWDVGPVLARAEAAQREWLAAHRPAAVERLDDAALLQLKRELWREHRDRAHDVGALRRALLDALQRRSGYSEADIEAGTETAFAVFLGERQRVVLYDTVLPVLEQLAGRYRIAALSNGNADVFLTEAAPYFEFALSAAEVGASKPDPALFEAALQRAEVPAAAAVHIGDHPEHDIDGARRAGLRSIWLNNRGRQWPPSPDGPPPADAEIRCLSELPAVLAALEASAAD
jgi:putative hydrolase of the HAD superfamily